MRVIRTASSLVALVLFYTYIAQAQIRSDHSVMSSKYEPQHKLLIIADNQEHQLTGVPLSANNSRSDRFITSVARRSPLVNVGGRLLFREAIRFGIREGAGLVLHLGDATDISCPDELSSVFDALDMEAEDIWFMAPGNHDGIQVGNYVEDQPAFDYDLSEHEVYTTKPNEEFDSVPEAWLNACLSPTYSKKGLARTKILTRGDAIELYVKRLKQRPDAKLIKTIEDEATIKPNIPVRCRVEEIGITPRNPSAGYRYTAIARICEPTPVTGDPKKRWVGPYASFIVQRLDIGKTRIIMLDTSDYENPYLPYVAFTGDLSEKQMAQAKLLLGKGEFDRKNVIVIGHHPLAVFRKKQRQWIMEQAGRYISAHTHYSASKINHPRNGPKTVELNVGSTLDYPPQAVIAYLGPTAMSFRVAGAKTGWDAFLAPCRDEENRKKWRFPLVADRPNFYTDYRSDLYVKHLLKSLDAAAKVAPSGSSLDIPTGDKVGDWLLLERALQTINAAEGDDRTFWACQAYYASEATKDEKSWWEWLPKFGWGFQKGADATTDGWHTLTSP